MRANANRTLKALIIFFFTTLPFSNLFAQVKNDLRHIYPPFAQPDWMPRKTEWQKTAFAQSDSILELVGLWPWGPCVAVAARDNYAFVGNGGLFQVFDISNPSDPQITGELFFGGLLVYGIAVSGNYVYIPDGDLKVIAVSDPANPQLAAQLYIPGDFAHRIIISGNYAYLGTLAGQIIIVDISSPTAPVIKSNVYLNDQFVMEMAIANQHLFVTDESPIDPIHIYDVSNPTNPTLAGYYPVRNYGFTAADNLLYLYAADNSFRVLDVTTPTTPKLIGRLPTSFSGRIVVKESLAYIMGNTVLTVIDVSDPSKPVLRGTAEGSPVTRSVSMAVVPPLVVAATETGFSIFDTSNPDSLLTLKHFATGDAASKIAIKDNLAYLACLKAGLFIVDVSDSRSPKFVSNLLIGGWVDDIAIVDSLVYLSGYGESQTSPPELYIVSVARLYQLQMLSHIPVLPERPAGGLYPTSVAVLGDYAFVTHNSGLSIIDVSDKNNPRLVKWIQTNRIPVDVATSGKFVCLANSELGLRIFDISDPENPRETAATSGFAVGVTTRNDTIFIATEGLAIFIVSSLGDLRMLGEVATPGSRTTVDISLQQNLAYMTYNENLVVVDFSNPTQPYVVDHTITPAYADGVAIKSNHILVAGGPWALEIYRNNLVTQIDANPSNRLPHSPRLFLCYPNPFNAFSTIEYEIPQNGKVEIKIFNTFGEEVAELINSWHNAGHYRILVDGTRLPSGVYLYRLRFNNWQAYQKMLILK